MNTVKMEHGEYLFKLDEVIKESGVSINKIMKDTNTDFKVIQRIIKGDLVRFDLFVLARLCDYFDCEMTDIIQYQKYLKQKQA